MSDEEPIEFGPFRMDSVAGRLWRGSQPVPLTPKAFALLQYLAQRPGRLVPKSELMDAVWPGVFVGDAVLKVCVGEIRKALLDDAKAPRFIETAHRRGYRFLGMVEPPQRDHSPSVFLVGREDETRRLHACIDSALQGQRHVVFVTGEAGIGKTTVVDACLERAVAARRLLVARGQALETFGASEAYLPVLDALADLVRVSEGSTIVPLMRRLSPTWLLQMPWLTEPEDRPALQKEAGVTRGRMLREFAVLLEAVAAERPLAIVLEDLHWSDDSTLDLLSYLIRRREPARLAIIATYRPGSEMLTVHPLRDVQRTETERRCQEIALRSLDESAVATYMSSRFAEGGLPLELARLIHRRTEGNPLLMVNAADDLVARGVIAFHSGRWELSCSPAEIAVGVSESIRQMTESKFDRLPEEDRRLLGGASVAGLQFSASVLAGALGQDVAGVEERCVRLARQDQFLRPASARGSDEPGTARFAFGHSLNREVIYGRLAVASRTRWHDRIGTCLERIYAERVGEIAAELAMHFERGGNPRRAVAYLRLATENAIRRFANQEAVTIARRGLTLLGTLSDDDERARLELALQHALSGPLAATRGYAAPEVEQTYTRVRALSERLGDGGFEGVRPGLWRFALIRADLDAARALAIDLLRSAERRGDEVDIVEAHWALGVTLVNAGEFARAKQHLDNGIERASARPDARHLYAYGHDPRVVCRCFGAWALWSLGQPDRAVMSMREALNLAWVLSHPESTGFALFFSAWVHQLRREADRTLEETEALIAHASEHGLLQWLTFGRILRGWSLGKRGRGEEGVQAIRESLIAYQAMGSRISRPHFLGLLAETLGGVGRFQEGLSVVIEALAEADRTGERYYESELLRLYGELQLRQDPSDIPGQPVLTRAEDCFQRALGVAREQGARSFELRAALGLSKLHARCGQDGESRRALADLYGGFTEGLATADLIEARAFLDQKS